VKCPLWWQRLTARITANLFVLMHMFVALRTGEVWVEETRRDGGKLVYIGVILIPKGVSYSDTILDVKIKRRVFWQHPNYDNGVPDVGSTFYSGSADRS
jgi:hypothetical protein